RLYRIAVSLRERDPATLLTAGLGLARIALADRNLAAIRDARMVFTPLDGNKSLPDLALAHAEISAYESLLDGHVEEAKQAIGTVVAGLRTLALAPREIQAAWAMGRALQAVDPHAADLLLMEAHDLSRRCGMWGYSRRIAEDRLASRPGVPILARSGSGEGEFLSRAIELLNSLQEFPVLLQRSLDLAGETVGADRGFILLHEEGDSGLRVMAAFGDVDESARTSAHEVSRTIVKRVTRTGESFLTEDAGEDPRLGSTQSLLDLPVRSLLCVPLRIRERVVGTIYLESRAHTAQFSVDDRDLLESFAHLVAVAIENGRLHDELKRSRERVIRENLSLRQDVSKKFARPNIIAQSAQMERVLDEAERVAMSRISVHIAGATGTGKELIAKHIHYASPRADQPFIAVNCGAINKDLMESELFGIVSGAASNVTEHKGFFERANGGTLFLDEIGDMPVDVQIKLLRVLEEREFTPVRGTRVVRTDFRVISATNQDLRQLMRDGQFRSDLFFRIRGHEIRLPSLRERPVDIPLLAQHFLQKFCEENGLPVPRISPRFIDVILHHAWPGNVRDLRNYVESCRFQSRGPLLEPVIQPEEVMDPLESVTAMHPGNDPPSQAPAGRSNSELRSDVREFERAVLVRGLDQANWIQRRAAERLGLSESTLRAKIRTHGIKSPPGQEPKRGRPSREQRESES
ncbi:MAG: sigma 54-interacting transcriptional regulator, partial [Thermoanaerobaculia bacterium]